jgi:hypothetical protein
MAIPPKIYKTWQFPENYLNDNGLSDEEMKNMVVFTFLMDKDKDAEKYSVYRAKGPTRVDFGRLFYNFILDYNDKHPTGKIQIEDENGLFNWVFFLQPKWYEATKYIDPDLTLYMNGIEENSVVFCLRTGQVIADEREEIIKTDYEFTREDERKRNTKKEEYVEVISQDQ